MSGRWSGPATRRQMCERKIRYTEPEATLITERMDGYDTYPCPFSERQYHWHVSRHGAHADGADPFWWSHVQASAVTSGGLGYPEGYVRRQLEQAWDRANHRALT